MPRPLKAIDNCFIQSDNNTKKIQCTICEYYTSADDWFDRDNDKRHLTSRNHLRNVEATDMRIAASAARQNQNNAINSALARFEIPAERPKTVPAHIPSAAEEEMWDNYHTEGAAFSAGEDPGADVSAQHARLEKQADEFGRWNAAAIARNMGFLGDDSSILNEQDEEDAIQCEIMDNAQLLETLEIEDMVDTEMGQTRTKSSKEWFPYPSKMMFLLDTLDNLPRQRVSNSLMKVFLWILREGGARDVPSLDALRKLQSTLHKQGGIPTVPWKSTQGNVFHLNDIRTIIAKDYANPLTRKLLHFYPEIPDGPIGEAWHAQKWRREIDRDALTPMIVDGHRHFYVDELARLHDGSFVIPICWVMSKGRMCADAYPVFVDEGGMGHVDDSTELFICAADLKDNFYDLEFKKMLPVAWDLRSINAGYFEMPNPLCKLANGRPLYTSFVDLFFDDVSGNRSKSWNKHYNCYCTHRNLPRALLQQEFHTHFVTTSPHASSSEQFEGIKALILSTHSHPVSVYDENDQEEAAFRLFVNTGPSDNPMGSEMTGHIGAKGNYFCRKCKVGGTGEHKRTDDGFHCMFEAGLPRTAADTLRELQKQVELACYGVEAAIKARQTDSGVKDAYTSYWIKDLIRRAQELKKGDPTLASAEIVKELMDWVKANESTIYNPFLGMKGFDVSKDTPIEILHTILLGIVKYAWHPTHTGWNLPKKTTYTLRLEATNTVGLSIPPIRASYIMQFANSLIGRQFKQVAQTCVFHMYDLTDGLQFAAWKAMGELLPLLWYPEINNLDQYLVDVETAVSNVLDIFAMLDPTKLIAKNKLHVMAHTKTDILRHGVLLGSATESFECFNAIFRQCSILSNHLAPSRDIARQLAHQEGLKHRLTGGWWLSSTGEWERAGSSVRDFLTERPILQALLGWTNPKSLQQGAVRLTPLKRIKGKATPPRPNVKLADTKAKTAINIGEYTINSTWQHCINVVSKSKDICPLASWVYAISPVTNVPTLGRIEAILTDGCSPIVILDVFQISDERHPIFNLPKLFRRQEERTLLIVPSTNIQFLFNVQHDCSTANCTASGIRAKMQERVESSVTESFVEHQPVEKWVINTTAFHNAHLLRRSLPRSAWAPVPMFTTEGRLAKHHELAESLRSNHSKRKAAAAVAGTQADGPNEPGVQENPKKRKRAKGKGKGKEKSAPAKEGRPRKRQKIAANEASGSVQTKEKPKKRRGPAKKAKDHVIDNSEPDAESDLDLDRVSDEEQGMRVSDEERGTGEDDSDPESGADTSEDEIYVARPTRRPRGQVPE
ncbi:hypothetical protein C8F04DRAFT_1395981 [Mycena alexandri]|uniref:Uncharacterized protein n=1 Tax=Mycena alexandri TaxID=1745969 RepID=A0AAD6STU0_9AGAR|nr:hypothetical protein C8F04DRAFT_1395981 [Mycena alexandri]